MRTIQLDGNPNAFQLMNEIVRDMKEIPELPSEVPQDQQALLRVDYPEEGGLMTWMSGNDYAYRGFPFFEMVEKIDVIKKITRGTLSGLYHSLKKTPKIFLLTLVPAIWLFRNIVVSGIYTFYRLVERSRVKSKYFSQSVRELYRAFTVPQKEAELRLQLRDLVCTVLEFDNAYRFRFQDVVAELNKDALKSNPIRELLRLLDLAISRETGQEIRDTWRLAKMSIRAYFWLDRSLLRTISKVLSELDLDLIALTPEDKNYCAVRTDYNFRYRENPTQEDAKIIFGATVSFERGKALEKMRREYLEIQKSLLEKHQKDQRKSSQSMSDDNLKELTGDVNVRMGDLIKKFEKDKKEVLESHLTSEQKELISRQQLETENLIREQDGKLKEIDEEYATKKLNYIKCQ